MEQFSESKSKEKENLSADDIVDNAIARMKSGAVVKEERTDRLKFAFFTAAFIAAIVAFLTYDFVYQNPNSETAANGDIVITLKQGQQGHYYATGKINAEPVKFLVDTGATDVAIPMSVAKKLDLRMGRKLTTITANGYGTAYETTIKTIQLGDITLKGVKASVSEGMIGDAALLGMSFLSRTKVEQHKGIMTITY